MSLPAISLFFTIELDICVALFLDRVYHGAHIFGLDSEAHPRQRDSQVSMTAS